MKSPLWSLNLRDAIKGLIMTIIAAFVATAGVTINQGRLPTKQELLNCAMAALAAGVSYLFKNLATNKEDELLTKDLPGNLKKV